MKPNNQACVALTTMPGSLEASSRSVLRYVLLLYGAEAQQEEQAPIVAQQDKTRAASVYLRPGWAGQWDQLVLSELRLNRPLLSS